MRAFIAIRLEPAIRAAIAEALAALPPVGGIKPVPPENLHLTLKFLGEIDRAQEQEVCRILRAVAAGHAPFALEARGTGAFPNRHRPRSLWVGLAESPALTALATAVRSQVPYGDGGRFSPHLTVGRIQGADDTQRDFLPAFFALSGSFGCQTVAEIALMESRLGGGTPVYTCRAVAALGAR